MAPKTGGCNFLFYFINLILTFRIKKKCKRLKLTKLEFEFKQLSRMCMNIKPRSHFPSSFISRKENSTRKREILRLRVGSKGAQTKAQKRVPLKRQDSCPGTSEVSTEGNHGALPSIAAGNSLLQGLHPLFFVLQFLLHLGQLSFQSGKLKTNNIFLTKTCCEKLFLQLLSLSLKFLISLQLTVSPTVSMNFH